MAFFADGRRLNCPGFHGGPVGASQADLVSPISGTATHTPIATQVNSVN